MENSRSDNEGSTVFYRLIQSQEELLANKPVLLATNVQNAEAHKPPTQHIQHQQPHQHQALGNGHLLLSNMDKLLAASGKTGKPSVSALLNQGGPATIAKLVSQKEANCDVQSGEWDVTLHFLCTMFCYSQLESTIYKECYKGTYAHVG